MSSSSDTAELDGCSAFGVFWRVMVPLALPDIPTLAVPQSVAASKAFLLQRPFIEGPTAGAVKG